MNADDSVLVEALVSTTMEYDEGCEAGKRRFLAEFGIDDDLIDEIVSPCQKIPQSVVVLMRVNVSPDGLASWLREQGRRVDDPFDLLNIIKNTIDEHTALSAWPLAAFAEDHGNPKVFTASTSKRQLGWEPTGDWADLPHASTLRTVPDNVFAEIVRLANQVDLAASGTIVNWVNSDPRHNKEG